MTVTIGLSPQSVRVATMMTAPEITADKMINVLRPKFDGWVHYVNLSKINVCIYKPNQSFNRGPAVMRPRVVEPVHGGSFLELADFPA